MGGKVGKREDYKKGEGGMTENMKPPLELHVFLWEDNRECKNPFKACQIIGRFFLFRMKRITCDGKKEDGNYQ
ncbi:hypothetical protein AKG34_20040 [Peribacillus butanolivorans]|nr:hypothetical protein AKG34_20040 [Peribacillus butanolivorans]